MVSDTRIVSLYACFDPILVLVISMFEGTPYCLRMYEGTHSSAREGQRTQLPQKSCGTAPSRKPPNSLRPQPTS